MTGVRRPGLQRVSPSPSQQLPFMRLRWLWGHLHHNSCHRQTPSPPHTHTLSAAHCPTETNKHTHTHWHKYTRAHTQLLQLNANAENQKGIRDGCCLRTPLCGFAWMRPKGGEVSDTTGCWRGGGALLGPLGCVTMLGGLSGWQIQGFSTRTTPWHSTRACYTTVTWVAQVTFEPMEFSHMCPLCQWILCQSHICYLVWISLGIESLVFRLATKHSGYRRNWKWCGWLVSSVFILNTYDNKWSQTLLIWSLKSLNYASIKESILQSSHSWYSQAGSPAGISHHRVLGANTEVCWINIQRWVGATSITVIVAA